MASATTSTADAARKLAKHFHTHWDLPMKLERYLSLYHGFHRKKVKQTIPIPKAIEIFDTRTRKVVSYYENTLTSPALESLKSQRQSSEAGKPGLHKKSVMKDTTERINSGMRKIDFNTLVYPHERVILHSAAASPSSILNQRALGKPLRKPVPMVYALYKPFNMKGDLIEEQHNDMAQWLSAISDELQVRHSRALSGQLSHRSGRTSHSNLNHHSSDPFFEGAVPRLDTMNHRDNVHLFGEDGSLISDFDLLSQAPSAIPVYPDESTTDEDQSAESLFYSELALRIHLIGRLDRETSGLILATNDSMLETLLISEQCALSRVFRVNVARLHADTKFRRLQMLASDGITLRKSIGHVRALKVKSRGRLDSFEYDWQCPHHLRILEDELDGVFFDESGRDTRTEANESLKHAVYESDNELKRQRQQMIDSERERINRQSVGELQNKMNQLRKELDSQAGKVAVTEDNFDGKRRMAKRLKLEETKFEHYISDLSRQTQWDIELGSGQNKWLKQMIKNLGFVMKNSERVGYGPFHIDDPEFANGRFGEDTSKTRECIRDMSKEQWGWHNRDLMYRKRNENLIRNWEVGSNGRPKHPVRRLLADNTYQLSPQEIDRLWHYAGGHQTAVSLRLQTLLDRAIHLNDGHFWDWLHYEHRIQI